MTPSKREIKEGQNRKRKIKFMKDQTAKEVLGFQNNFENFGPASPGENGRKQQMKTLSVRNSMKAATIASIGLVALFCSTSTMYAPPVNKLGDGSVPTTMREFTTPGVTTFTVPTGVIRILVEVWGAGGGGGAGDPTCPTSYTSYGGFGGAGAYSRAVLTVAAGDTVQVTVGQGGNGGSGSPGSPGGFSRVQAPTSVITSGGGGGGGAAPYCSPGAAGSPGTPDPNAAIGRFSATFDVFCNCRPGGYTCILITGFRLDRYS